MPSQSRSDGDSTPDHWMTTDSPDRFRALGEIEIVSLAFAEETKTETKRRKKDKLPIMAIIATEEMKNDCGWSAGEERYIIIMWF